MTGSYQPWLVVLSIVVAIAASAVALDLASRVAATIGSRSAKFRLLGGAISLGTGIWSMHFIGMLAFQMPVPMSYEPGTTLASLVIAFIASGFALYTVSRGTLNRSALAASGVLMGLGISSMHYTGMAAMKMDLPIRYDPWLFGLSILVAIIASTGALWFTFRLRSETIPSASWSRFGSAIAMGVAISGMHYIGMLAAEFPSGSGHATMAHGVSDNWHTTTR